MAHLLDTDVSLRPTCHLRKEQWRAKEHSPHGDIETIPLQFVGSIHTLCVTHLEGKTRTACKGLTHETLTAIGHR